MAGSHRDFPSHNSARKALHDRLTREQVGEETWNRWQEDARKDKSFLWFGVAFIIILGLVFFWLAISGN